MDMLARTGTDAEDGLDIVLRATLGLGDEALVEMDGNGSSTYAGKLLVRYGERTVLVVTNSPTSTLERLSRVAALFY